MARDPGRDLSSMRILVTGASGFIGSHLVCALSDRGAHVYGLSRSGRMRAVPNRDSCAANIRWITCDLRFSERTRRIVRAVRPHLVFHLAAHPDGRESGEQIASVLKSNIEGLAHLLEALRGLSDVALVFGDSAKVYGTAEVPYRSTQALEPLSTYAVSKVAGWGLIDVYRRVHGLQTIGLRPTLVYGPGQGFNLVSFVLESIKLGDTDISLDGGVQTRDPIYIDDAVIAFILAAEHVAEFNGCVFPMGGGHEVSVADIAKLAVHLLGGHQKVITRPQKVRPTDTMRSWCDNAEITQALGWSPAVDLAGGILRTAEWLGLSPAPVPSIVKG